MGLYGKIAVSLIRLLCVITWVGCGTPATQFERTRSYSLDEVNIRDGRVFHGKRLIPKGYLIGSYSANEGIRMFLKAAIERGLISSAKTLPPSKSDWRQTVHEWNGLIITDYNSEGGVLTEIAVNEGKLGRKTTYAESNKTEELPATQQAPIEQRIVTNLSDTGNEPNPDSGRQFDLRMGGNKKPRKSDKSNEQVSEASGKTIGRVNAGTYKGFHQGGGNEEGSDASDSWYSNMCCWVVATFVILALFKN